MLFLCTIHHANTTPLLTLVGSSDWARGGAIKKQEHVIQIPQEREEKEVCSVTCRICTNVPILYSILLTARKKGTTAINGSIDIRTLINTGHRDCERMINDMVE